MKTVSFRFAQLINIGLFGFTLLSVGLGVSPAYALPPIGDHAEEVSKCLGEWQGSISITPQTVELWQNATLSWNVKDSSCGQLYINGQVVLPTGSRSIQPIADTIYTLHAQFLRGRRTLASAAIKVTMPSIVTINTNHLAPLLMQALRTKGTYISVANHVELDLSGREYISIAAGVTLAGGRTPRQPGPRLYTTTRPRFLFGIDGDNVRITGVRIQGADMGVADGDGNCCSAIYTNSFVNIDIHNNEIFGWRGSAVEIRDSSERIDYVTNPETVRVRDNYIHHNQHVGRLGYGVQVKEGAYALIERNVFDWNRHAIAGDGSDGSGYVANENLVLSHGGLHRWMGGAWTHTHQFDMHGQSHCGVGEAVLDVADVLNPFGDPWSDTQYNCGTAGHSVFIRRNTFLYTEDEAIKLRGTPQLQPYGMFVESNVFAHGNSDDAMTQNESGLWHSDNLYSVDGSAQLDSCDFDADGIDDAFMATGATWWFSSRGQMHWTYLRASTKQLSDVTLGYFDGDNRCDVSVDGTIYPGGKSPVFSHVPTSGGVASPFLSN